MPSTEPKSDPAVYDWIAQQMKTDDPFAPVAALSDRHRTEHGCDVYPSTPGHLLGVLAGATRARRILEIGCGLGYSTLWLAFGSAPAGVVETIEVDNEHAALARDVFSEHSVSERITVHDGLYTDLLPQFVDQYDLIFYDAAIPASSDLDQFARLTAPGGLLVTSNLFLGRFVPDSPDLNRGAEYRHRLLADENWYTAFAGMKALSVRR